MVASIFINGIIGTPNVFENGEFTSFNDVERQFESFEKPDSITVYIDSIGGSYRDGFRIKNFLQNTGLPITAIVTGDVFSIATIILLSAPLERRFASKDSNGLIHNPKPAFPTDGDAAEHEARARDLRKIEDHLASVYAENTTLSFNEAKAEMSKDELIRPDDMIRMGLIAGISERLQAVAMFDLNIDDMSNTEELKGISKTLADIKKRLFSNEKSPLENVPVVDLTEAKTDETPALQARIDELEAELAESKAKNKEVIENNTALEDTATKQTEAINQFKTQFVALEKQIQGLEAEKKELESTPIIQTEKKSPTYTNKAGKSVNYPADVLAHLNQITTNFNNR